jgi:DNA-directed RNA polymerase specialized sigma24 family protein
MERRPVGDEDRETIRLLGEDVAMGWLAELPSDQRAAVEARVLRERSYEDIAHETGSSEVAVRMRVSRGLSTLRGRLRGSR